MGGGVVVSHENGIPWTLPFPSVVEKWSQGGGRVKCDATSLQAKTGN